MCEQKLSVFSADYWRAARRELNNPRVLAFSGLVCAMAIVLESLPIYLLDYVLAFTLLGLAGAIAKPFKNRLVGVAVGTAAVCGIRFLCSFLSGVLIWGNLSDGLPAWTYSLTYNGSYMLPETLLTMVAAVLLCRVAPQIFDRQHAKA